MDKCKVPDRNTLAGVVGLTEALADTEVPSAATTEGPAPLEERPCWPKSHKPEHLDAAKAAAKASRHAGSFDS